MANSEECEMDAEEDGRCPVCSENVYHIIRPFLDFVISKHVVVVAFSDPLLGQHEINEIVAHNPNHVIRHGEQEKLLPLKSSIYIQESALFWW